MKDKRKSIKVLSVILSAFMLVSMLPMFVFAGNTDPIEITAQPENISATAGEEMSMTVTAKNATSYQWQRSSDGQTWSNIGSTNNNYSGVKTKTLTVKVNNGTAAFVYRCVVKNSTNDTVTTDSVKMIKANDFAITTQPVDFIGVVGDTAAFNVIASGDGLTYQWQKSDQNLSASFTVS